MNINSAKNLTKDLELDNQNNLEIVDSLNDISMDELKQKVDEYLENNSNQLYQSNIDKKDFERGDTIQQEISESNVVRNNVNKSEVRKDNVIQNEISKKSINSEILKNDKFESRTPLGKITIKDSVIKSLSKGGMEIVKELLIKNIKKENVKNFLTIFKEGIKKSFEFVKKHAATFISVAGKLIKKL